MTDAPNSPTLADTGERIIPTRPGEVSIVFEGHLVAYRYAAGFIDGKDVLDAGCGVGYGAAMLAETARHVLGIDRERDAVAYAGAHYARPNVEYRRLDLADLSTLDERFDVAVCFQVIEHLSDPGRFLDDLRSVLRSGGVIIITTPNVRRPAANQGANPFHASEMNYDDFRMLLSSRFDDFDLLGVDYARPNALRAIAERLPFYSWLGRRLRRGSAVKKAAVRAMGLSEYHVIRERVARDATDLLAVCRT